MHKLDMTLKQTMPSLLKMPPQDIFDQYPSSKGANQIRPLSQDSTNELMVPQRIHTFEPHERCTKSH